MSKRMKRPSPEAAYMMGLVAAQRHRVEMAEYDLRTKTAWLAQELESAKQHLEGLEHGLKRVKRDVRYARRAAAMPWLKDDPQE